MEAEERRRQEQAREAERRRREEEQRRHAEQVAKEKAHEIFRNFEREAGVASWVNERNLNTNPFVYEDEIVGVRTNFETMLDKDRALFGSGPESAIVVSGIPSTLFTARKEILLAARVRGKEYVKLPMLGDTLMPHSEPVREV